MYIFFSIYHPSFSKFCMEIEIQDNRISNFNSHPGMIYFGKLKLSSTSGTLVIYIRIDLLERKSLKTL